MSMIAKLFFYKVIKILKMTRSVLVGSRVTWEAGDKIE